MGCLCGIGPRAMMVEPCVSTKVQGGWEDHVDFPLWSHLAFLLGFFERFCNSWSYFTNVCVEMDHLGLFGCDLCISTRSGLSCSGRRRAATSVPSRSMQAIMELLPVLRTMAGLLVASTYYL